MVGRTEAATPLSRVQRDAQRARRPPRRVPTQRLDAEAGRQRVGQPTGQHPSGCPVDDRDQSPGWAAKSKCMRDRNLGMSGSRGTRVAPGSIGVRSRLPAGANGIRTLVPDRTRDPTLSKHMFPGENRLVAGREGMAFPRASGGKGRGHFDLHPPRRLVPRLNLAKRAGLDG